MDKSQVRSCINSTFPVGYNPLTGNIFIDTTGATIGNTLVYTSSGVVWQAAGGGLPTLGTAGQMLRVNAGATALEYFTPTFLTGLTVGTTPIASGTAGRILYEGAGNVLQEAANLFWDNTNSRLNINAVSSPTGSVSIKSPTTTGLALQIRNNADTLNNLAFNGNSQLLTQNAVSTLTLSHRTDVNGFSLTTGTSGYGTGTGVEVIVGVSGVYMINGSIRGLQFSNDTDSPDLYRFYSQGNANGKRLSVQVNSTERFAFNPNGNFHIGYGGANTAAGTITIGNQTAPTGNTTNAIQIYSQNQTNASFHVRDSNSRVFYAGEKVGMRSNHDLQLAANDTVYLTISTAGLVTLADASNIAVGTTTGTKIGTATTQKLSFWNKTPIVQPTTAITGATLVSNGGTTITSTDTFGGYTLQQIAAALINTGILQ